MHIPMSQEYKRSPCRGPDVALSKVGPVVESLGVRVCASDEAVEGLEHFNLSFYYCRDILGGVRAPPLVGAVEGRTPLHATALLPSLQRRPHLRDPSGWSEGRRPPASRRGGGSGGGEVVETTPFPPSSSQPIVVRLPSGAPPAVSGGGDWNAAPPHAVVPPRLHHLP
ncbi:hypothetical protein Sjap_018419 [Stephania japonica]|uniref:Uncharacterized protein n=1 Tax=Stephania japonica TaxID=461633 RepID=A0AAP0I7Y4_9MAGN